MFDQVTLRLNADPLILSALREDITSEDVSTNSVMPVPRKGEVNLICKQDGVICGLQIFERVFTLLDENTEVELKVADGDRVKKGQLLAVVRGDIKVLLCGERTALNYLQRMSGIATYTSEVVKLLEGTGIKLLDTRKTTPNNRLFEKYAVKVGGGNNHRYNHIKCFNFNLYLSYKWSILLSKIYCLFNSACCTYMVKYAVEAGADIIMLDNMDHDTMAEAMRIIDGKAEVEVSGNMTKENLAKLSGLSVNYVSSGALTHSAPIMDISLKNLHPVD